MFTLVVEGKWCCLMAMFSQFLFGKKMNKALQRTSPGATKGYCFGDAKYLQKFRSNILLSPHIQAPSLKSIRKSGRPQTT